MEIFVKTFDELTTRELYEILKVRAAVFVVEQNCVYQDLDDKDDEAVHVFLKEDEEIVSYARVFKKKDEQDVFQMGRVLTVRRNEGYGKKTVSTCLNVCKDVLHGKEVFIEAQCYARAFYESFGFQKTSEEFLEDGILHIEMRTLL